MIAQPNTLFPRGESRPLCNPSQEGLRPLVAYCFIVPFGMGACYAKNEPEGAWRAEVGVWKVEMGLPRWPGRRETIRSASVWKAHRPHYRPIARQRPCCI